MSLDTYLEYGPCDGYGTEMCDCGTELYGYLESERGMCRWCRENFTRMEDSENEY